MSKDEEVQTLDQVLEQATGEVENPEEETPEEESTAEESTEETTEEESKEETEEKASTPDEEKKDEPWHLKAVLDEREKRQAAQRELEELRKKLAESENKDEAKTSVFDDEGKFRNELLQEFESARINDRLNISQALVEDQLGSDVVAEKVKTFKELAEANPDLRARFSSSPLPYKELIKIVDQHEEAKKLENIDEYKAKLRAEVRAEIESEIKSKEEQEAKKRESITPSLASKRSAGGNEDTNTLIGAEDVFDG